MRLDLDISTDDSAAPDKAFVQKVAEQAVIRGIKNVDVSTVFSLDVVFVSEDKIRSINKEYRDKDAVTDVLSFGDYAEFPAGFLKERDAAATPFSQIEPVVLGQLFLCYDYIKQAAEEDEVTLEREMAYILSHGVLHLLGYDHTDEMFAIQDTISGQF